jgi:branched-chain amino acid transport system ATP-binding protein
MSTVVSPATATGNLLEVSGLTAGYDGRSVIYDVDLTIGRGEAVVLLGSNGAGKTTTLKSIVGLLPPQRASIRYDGTDRSGRRASECAGDGISFIPAERFTFANLTIEENLGLGAYTVASAEARDERRNRVLELFPILGQRLTQKAGTMSGGEQRMLSVAVALMAAPRLLLLDEPSLGLAPAIVEQLMAVVGQLQTEDQMSVLMVEQNVGQALTIADRVYVMRSGRIILEESAEKMRARDEWWDLF